MSNGSISLSKTVKRTSVSYYSRNKTGVYQLCTESIHRDANTEELIQSNEQSSLQTTPEQVYQSVAHP